MPRIKEFTNTQTIDAGPLAGAAQDQERAGYYAGQSLEQGATRIVQGIGIAEEHIASNESAKLAADLSTAHAELATEWEESLASADPNDHELATRFQEQKVKPRLAKIGEGLLTNQAQNNFTRMSAGVNADLFTKSTADQARLAGEAAITNLDTTINQQSNVSRADPTGLAHSLSFTKNYIDGLVADHRIPREAAIKLQRQAQEKIAQSAIDGAIEKNASAAAEALQRGDYNDLLPGDKIASAIDAADRRIRLDNEAKRQADRDADEAKKEAANQAYSDNVSQILRDPKNVNLRGIADNPLLTGPQKTELYHFRESVMGGDEGKKLGAGFWSAYQKVTATGKKIDPNEIYRMAGPDGPLTLAGANELVEISKRRQSDESKGDYSSQVATKFFSMIHDKIMTPEGIDRRDIDRDQAESDSFKAFMNMNERYKVGRAKGLTQRQLLDPDSKEYIGYDLKDYQGHFNDSTFVDTKPAVASSFNIGDLDKMPAGKEGSPKGIAELQSAVRGGFISRDKAKEYAAKRGWVASGAMVPPVKD